MEKPKVSPAFSLLFLALREFLTLSSVLVLGPLLVELAGDSVAVAGQLAGATPIDSGITRPLTGRISDSYCRPLLLLAGVMLLGVGFLGSVVAWNYVSLLGVTATDRGGYSDGFSHPYRSGGRHFSTGSPRPRPSDLLLDVGGWRLPFLVFGA